MLKKKIHLSIYLILYLFIIRSYYTEWNTSKSVGDSIFKCHSLKTNLLVFISFPLQCKKHKFRLSGFLTYLCQLIRRCTLHYIKNSKSHSIEIEWLYYCLTFFQWNRQQSVYYTQKEITWNITVETFFFFVFARDVYFLLEHCFFIW